MTPQETVLADLQAQHPDQKLIAKQTKQGLVVLRIPTPAEIDAFQSSKEARRKADDQLVLSCGVYPAKEVLAQYFATAPLMGTALAVSVKAAAVGIPKEEVPDVQGFPSDLTDDKSQIMGAKAVGRDVWQVTTDQGRITLRLPVGVELDNWETSKLSPRAAAEALVLGCVLDPDPNIVRGWFLKRPYMGAWLGAKLNKWCIGEIEELQGK